MATVLFVGGLHMNTRYERTTSGKFSGYDVYIDGEYVGWTAGNMSDARNFAKSIETRRAHDAGQPHPAHWVAGQDTPCSGIKRRKS